MLLSLKHLGRFWSPLSTGQTSRIQSATSATFQTRTLDQTLSNFSAIAANSAASSVSTSSACIVLACFCNVLPCASSTSRDTCLVTLSANLQTWQESCQVLCAKFGFVMCLVFCFVGIWARGKRRGFSHGAAARHRSRTAFRRIFPLLPFFFPLITRIFFRFFPFLSLIRARLLGN